MPTTTLSDKHLQQMSAEELEREIRRHNQLYWDFQRPELADTDYDRLTRRLKELRPESPVLQDLGPSEIGRTGAPVQHRVPMLSLDKCYSDEELAEWASKFEGEVLVTPKFDGIAASLRYDEHGYLSLAATRGNGSIGEDITANARMLSDIPQRIAGSNLEVRGEIYMRLSVFQRFAEEFANPRNLAAGAIKHKEPERCRAYRLSFAAYDLLGLELQSEQAKLQQLVALGFPPLESMLVGKAALRAGYAHFSVLRSKLDFEIDGVVFKANSLAEQRRLGSTAHHPRYGIAYKFQGDSAITTLRQVEWSVARSGAITPIALVDAVTLSGAEISRVSLHNAGYLRKLELLGRPPDAQVTVTRRGGVIPHVEGVVERSPLSSDGVPLELPPACPSCGGAIVAEGDFLYCATPTQCRSALIAAIAHYCQVIEIQGFGDKLLEQTYDAGLLRSPADLYALTTEALTALERVGEKLASKLLQQLAEHRTIELATFLRALGIEELGPQLAALLEEQYGSLERVRKVRVEELAAIHGVGPVIAEKVVRGLAQQAPLIERLLAHVQVSAAKRVAGRLTGQSFVFTGKLLAFDRKVGQQQVRALGGETPSAVSTSLSYLVVGDGAEERESSKLKQARRYIAEGATLKIISEAEFLALVGTA